MRVVITGGAGRFGAVTARRLSAAGHELVLLDRSEPKFELPAGSTFALDDLSSRARLHKHFAGAQAVVHLAAIPQPMTDPAEMVFDNNVTTTYHVLLAAVDAGVTHVCSASSINAIGAAYSRAAHFDYFPVDEQHPTYNEDPYSLSKWVGELAADSIARLHPHMTISSLRLHGLGKIKDRERRDPTMADIPPELRRRAVNHLWGYVDIDSSAEAVERCLHATFRGHEVFFIVSPRTVFVPEVSSAELAATHFPDVPLRTFLEANAGLFSCDKALQLLGWRHSDIALART
jgi:UDP-glucose 4-epimerase